MTGRQSPVFSPGVSDALGSQQFGGKEFMCGIAAVIGGNDTLVSAEKAIRILCHRGPEDTILKELCIDPKLLRAVRNKTTISRRDCPPLKTTTPITHPIYSS
jgi:hypothetical protein